MTEEYLGTKPSNSILKFRCNNRGQFAIEAVLLMTLLLGIFLGSMKIIRDKQMIQKFIEKPVEKLARMSAYGTWNEQCKGQGAAVGLGKCHPNSIHRSLSTDPQ